MLSTIFRPPKWKDYCLASLIHELAMHDMCNALRIWPSNCCAPKNASGVAVKFSIRINADEQFEYMEVGARELISELCLLGGSHSGAH